MFILFPDYSARSVNNRDVIKSFYANHCASPAPGQVE